MRDHTKLQVFHAADAIVIAIYEHTRSFPTDERYGLTSQIRRGAVSIVSNIVEGCARSTAREYHRFIEMAYASSRELNYQLGLARRLRFGDADEEDSRLLEAQVDSVAARLAALMRSLEAQSDSVPSYPQPAARSPQPPEDP